MSHFNLPPSRIDFAMVGYRHGDQFIILASDQVDEITLQHDLDSRFDDLRFTNDTFINPLREFIRLSGILRDYIMVIGDSYADCLRRLADYQAEGRGLNPNAIAQGNLEIEASRE